MTIEAESIRPTHRDDSLGTHLPYRAGRSRPGTFPGVWRVSRIVTTITAWSSPPRASSAHSRIHAVTAKLNPSTT